MNSILVLWIYLFSFPKVFSKVLKDNEEDTNWKINCLRMLSSEMQIKQFGIITNDEINEAENKILREISESGTSFSIVDLSHHQTETAHCNTKWESIGIKHALFLLKLDKDALHQWIKIQEAACEEICWIFFGDIETHRQIYNSFKTINCTLCLRNWIVFSKATSQNVEVCSMITHNELCPFMGSFPNNTAIGMVPDVLPSRNVAKNNLGQLVIRLAVNRSPPYLSVKSTKDGELVLDEGPEVELLRTIQEEFGFKYKILESSDGEWGRLVSGQWTGLIGMLAKGEADIASGCMSITYQRHKASYFSNPFDVQKSVIITKSSKYKPKTYAVLMPFSLQVWILILLVLFMFLFFLYGLGKVYNHMYERKPYRMDLLFWYLLGSACSEGGWLTNIVRGPSAVLLLGIWLFFVLVMQASYSGTLMSVLSFPSREMSVNNLKDLANIISNNGYKCGCIKGTNNCDTLAEMHDEFEVISKALYSDKKNFVPSVIDGLNKVLNENYAFLSQEITSIYQAQNMPAPRFHISSEGLDIELYSIALRKGLPYLRGINRIIKRLTEAGLIAKWGNDLTTANSIKFETRKSYVPPVKPLTLTELTGALYLFGYGLTFAMLIFIFEYLVWKRKSWRENIAKK